MRILVTGGRGFIGTNFCRYVLNNTLNTVISYDKGTYASVNDSDIKKNYPNRYISIRGDILDKEKVKKVLIDYKITHIVHFAAESHVDNSISGPEIFFRTNILGTATLLDAIRELDLINKIRFHHISTDEVFGDLTREEASFNETSPYKPSSPYSASKAASDMIVRSYIRTYGLKATISNCSNNYGPYQNPEKLIPNVVKRILKGEPIVVYDKGHNIRDWLYVEDHCRGIYSCLTKGKIGETYLFGGEEISNIKLINLIRSYLKFSKHIDSEITYNKGIRPGHDLRYSVNYGKAVKDLGWRPRRSLESEIINTVLWYLYNKKFLGVES